MNSIFLVFSALFAFARSVPAPQFVQSILPVGPSVIPVGSSVVPGVPSIAPLGPQLSHTYVALDHAKSEVRDEAGQYGISYKTNAGVEVAEQGYLKANGVGGYFLVKEGTYKYPTPDGQYVAYKFKADENGYNIEKV